MPTARRILPDLESFLQMPGWSRSDGLQISAGQIEVVSEEATVGDIRIVLNTLSATVLDRGVYDGENILVNVLLGGQRSAKYLGPVDLEEHVLVWRPGKKDRHEYILPRASVDLNIMFPATLADAMGWQVTEPFVKVRSSDHLGNLVRACLAALRVDPSPRNNALAGPSAQLLAALDSILAGSTLRQGPPMLSLAKARSYGIFEDAARLLEGAVHDQQMTMTADEIAQRLGVSRRSLFASFREWPGVGPHRYLALVRLHQLRKQLRKANREDTTITGEALRLGINHLGRLSAEYRELFGELPSDTLNRAPE